MPSDLCGEWQSKFDSWFPDGVMLCVGNYEAAPLYPSRRVEVIRVRDLIPKVSVQAYFAPKEFVFDVMGYEVRQMQPVPVVRITTEEDSEVTLSGGLSPALIAEMKESVA